VEAIDLAQRVEELAALVRSQVEEIRALREAVRRPATTLLSRPQVARELRVSRSRTLRLLERAGLLTPVPYLGEARFRSEDVERLKRDGLPPMAEVRRIAAYRAQQEVKPRRGRPPKVTAPLVSLAAWSPQRA